jgi:RHH-type proline utilization regulon transcriptional repressor/proline dehydrogenase/delta 1-pyrroline-5-carboxylate dehydrogenase
VEFKEKPNLGKRVEQATANYLSVWENEFSQEKDVSHIYGEENTFRYLPLKAMALRVQEKDAPEDVELVMTAAATARTPLTVSLPENLSQAMTEAVEKALRSLKGIDVKVQTEAAFIADMPTYERIRMCSPEGSDAIYKRAAELGLHIAAEPVLAEGRLELLHYLKEQSIAYEYHRYGSIFGEE